MRLSLVRAWQQKIVDHLAAKARSHHFGVATECFLGIAEDASLGGAEAGTVEHDAAVTIWMAAVLTAMLHVPGELPRPGHGPVNTVY